MSATRNASTRWTGDLQEGNGVTSFLSSGLPDTPVTWAARTNNPEGKTSPEELIAAAHTSCFSMAFSGALSRAGYTAEEIVTEAAVTFKPGTGITDIVLTMHAVIPGLDDDEFQKIAQGAKENCPVSQALKAVPISLEATLG